MTTLEHAAAADKLRVLHILAELSAPRVPTPVKDPDRVAKRAAAVRPGEDR
ncbi:hypothetical protein [Streptomyces sp. NPDC055036]